MGSGKKLYCSIFEQSRLKESNKKWTSLEVATQRQIMQPNDEPIREKNMKTAKQLSSYPCMLLMMVTNISIRGGDSGVYVSRIVPGGQSEKGGLRQLYFYIFSKSR